MFQFNSISVEEVNVYYLLLVLLHTRPFPVTYILRNVFDRLNTGIVGSNPNRDMDVCVRLFCVCVVLREGSGLETG
jgi:hypothetical protein